MGSKNISVDVQELCGEFPHYWETVVASSWAHTVLRSSYQNALAEVKSRLGFRQIRFHGIFTDSIGIYDEDENGNVACNFYLIDRIFDTLVEKEIEPFVELSFMPQKLAAKNKQIFFWKPYISLPNDNQKYQAMLRQFAAHLLGRYGAQRVRTWNFEVWNEPNLGGFCVGTMEDYFHLYRITAQAIREVDPALKIGGPATARCAWIKELIEFCHIQNLPLDFISTHLYRQDETFETADWVAGSEEEKMNNTIPEYVQQAKEGSFVRNCFAASRILIQQSPMPDLPLYFTEFNSFWGAEYEQRDSEYNAAFICQGIFDGRDYLDGLAYWTLSDDFEERGVNPAEFGSNFGLITRKGLFKPSFNAFQMLHRLGTRELHTYSETPCFATTDDTGTVSILIWNDTRTDNKPLTVDLSINNFTGNKTIRHSRVDKDHSNSFRAWQEIGSPVSPTASQITILKSRMDLEECAPPLQVASENVSLKIRLPSHAVSLIEFGDFGHG